MFTLADSLFCEVLIAQISLYTRRTRRTRLLPLIQFIFLGLHCDTVTWVLFTNSWLLHVPPSDRFFFSTVFGYLTLFFDGISSPSSCVTCSTTFWPHYSFTKTFLFRNGAVWFFEVKQCFAHGTKTSISKLILSHCGFQNYNITFIISVVLGHCPIKMNVTL